MPTSPARTPLVTEEAIPISDRMMVFRYTQGSSPERLATNAMLKSTKARLKLRKCTPTPTTEDNGRKRLSLSPFPEDKQLRKKIDFGEENRLSMDEPRCKGAIYPVNRSHGSVVSSKPLRIEADENPNKKEQEMAMVCFSPPNPNGEECWDYRSGRHGKQIGP